MLWSARIHVGWTALVVEQHLGVCTHCYEGAPLRFYRRLQAAHLVTSRVAVRHAHVARKEVSTR